MITLTDGSTTVTFPDGTHWTDERTYTPVVQSAERSIAGALLIDLQEATGGQAITLQSYDDISGWMPKDDVETIVGWSRVVGQELTLNLRGTIWTVMLRHHEAPAFDVTQVTYYDNPSDEDPFIFVLRLVDVTP